MKKFLAIILLIISAFLGLLFLGGIPFLIRAASGLRHGSAYDLGYALGGGAVLLVIGVMMFFCIKYALKWLRRDIPSATEILDDHLRENRR